MEMSDLRPANENESPCGARGDGTTSGLVCNRPAEHGGATHVAFVERDGRATPVGQWPRSPLPIVTADRANYATITVDRLTVQATATLDSNGFTRVTPEQPIPVSEGDVVRVTLAGRGAEPPAVSLEIVGEDER